VYGTVGEVNFLGRRDWEGEKIVIGGWGGGSGDGVQKEKERQQKKHVRRKGDSSGCTPTKKSHLPPLHKKGPNTGWNRNQEPEKKERRKKTKGNHYGGGVRLDPNTGTGTAPCSGKRTLIGC